MTHTYRPFAFLIALSLSACSGATIPNPFERDETGGVSEPIILVDDEPEVDLATGGQKPEALDRTSAAELAVAAEVKGGNFLGDTVASLGDATQQGLWLRTPLVSGETPGRVTVFGGKSLAVTLIPIAGEASAGSQISLAAMRGLDLGLTDLPTLQVFTVTTAG